MKRTDTNLFKKTDHDAKISEIQRWYITNSDYNKFMNNILHATMKQNELVYKSDISNLVKINDLNTKLANTIKSRAR